MNLFLRVSPVLFLVGFGGLPSWAGPFAPAAGLPGSTAVPVDDMRIAGWATAVESLVRGPVDAAFPQGAMTTYGVEADIIGPSGAFGSEFDPVASLGDGGSATLTFAHPLANLPGPDLAVFENSFNGFFLELAFVEVSSNGIDFVRFPAESLTNTAAQVTSFGSLDPTNLYNLAGKYEAGYGTPFDLSELAGSDPNLDVMAVTHVRVVDVTGSITAGLQSFDSMGRIVNDPYPTNFSTGGFDLDAVAAMWPASETYENWAARIFEPSESALAGFEDDFDRDGRVNGLEAAFLRDARKPDAGDVLEMSESGGGVAFSFVRVPWLPGLTYEMESSCDLDSWSTVAQSTNGEATVNIGALDVTETPVAGGWKVTVLLSAPSECYCRVRVTR